MPAYAVFAETVHDAATFDLYRAAVMPTLDKHGGRFLVRGGALSILEGIWPHPRLVIIEFPTRMAAERWYGSPEYQKILPMRLGSVRGNAVIVDGV